MFRVLDIGPTGAPRASDGSDLARPPIDGIRWVDVSAQTEADMALLQERFGLHPLAIEDCLHYGQRPKLEEYSGHLFIVTHAFCFANEQTMEIEVRELHAFLGPRWLVTVHASPIAPLDEAWKRAAADATLGRRGADFLYYLVADGIVDACFPVLDRIADELEEIEDAVLEGGGREELARIFRLKHALVKLRKVLAPQRDVMGLLTKRGSDVIAEKTTLYLRDVYDHLLRLHESVETGRDLLGNVLEAHLSMIANRTNEIMKRLTILSSIFLPLSFITGFFGQNFEIVPYKSSALFAVVMVACALVPISMLAWFKKSRWL